MRPTPIRSSRLMTDTVILDQGLNENITSIELKGGELIQVYNYELIEGSSGGYRSLRGYERFDGQTKPSSVYATEDDHTAQDAARAAITEVPGEGSVLGVHLYDGKVYAFRNKTGGATAGMYVESPSGWVEVDTSASPLNPNGDYNFITYNFQGTTGSTRMYWTDGENEARMYDGTTVTVISNSGMGVDDKPINLAAHNNRLFLAYRLSSLQYSTLGDPTDWTTGAGEIGLGGGTASGGGTLGKEITDLQVSVQNSLIVFCEDAIRILSGSTPTDWVLEAFSDQSGAFPHTSKRMFGTVFFMDDRGVSTLEAVQEYGDFAANSISERVKKTLINNKQNVTVSTVHRATNQYRLFFNDGLGLIFSFLNKKLRGITKLLFPHPVVCATEGKGPQKNNLVFFGSDNGFVYQMDIGTSFDGAPIEAMLYTAYYHYKSPRNWKRFNQLTFEIATGDPTTFYIRPYFDYGGPEYAKAAEESFQTLGAGGIWGEDKWGSLRLGGSRDTNRYYYNQLGIGTNMSLYLSTSETYKEQHTIQNFICDFSLLGRQK